MKEYTLEDIRDLELKKLGMESLALASKMWSKLKKEAGLSLAKLREESLGGQTIGFDTATEEEIAEFKKTLLSDGLAEFEAYDLDMQRKMVAQMKLDERNKKMELEFLDAIISNYYIVEEELLGLVASSSKIPKATLKTYDIEMYGTLLVKVVQENINFFKSVVKLKNKPS